MDSPAFKNSANRFKQYILSNNGFGLPDKNLLDLFDSEIGKTDQIKQLSNFLKKRSSVEPKPTDILIYYIGHGGFDRDVSSDYYLALRVTREGVEHATSFPIRDLAAILKQDARRLRRYVILDSCFSAAAYTAFQSTGPLEVAKQKSLQHLPTRGTSLLCASGPRDPAKILSDSEYTLFSNYLLQVLETGDADEGEMLSLSQVGELTKDLILDSNLDDIARPQVLSPSQDQGAIANLPLFPNLAHKPQVIEKSVPLLEERIAAVVENQRVLVLQSEGAETELGDTVSTSIDRIKQEEIRFADMLPDEEVCVIGVNEVLSSPTNWLHFVQALCKARVLVVDATNFEPAVMLFLGIRSVVRRGLTLTITSHVLDETQLSKLPFNIQETKLIGYEEDQGIEHPKHPINLIGLAIKKGFSQLSDDPRYRDLPSFHDVRCPEPPDHPRSIKNTVLVLCPFKKDYRHNWRYISNQLATRAKRIVPGQSPLVVRMKDIDSPRLVGPSLYEHLRWSKGCVVDWTGWRPNVFFELGVRLACSEFDPVSLIEESQLVEARDKASLCQYAQIIDLLRPTAYRLNDKKGEQFDIALDRHKQKLEQRYSPEATELAPSAAFSKIMNSYDWQQERVTQAPHEELWALVEAQMGKDSQSDGNLPALFSDNKDYLRQLRINSEERSIAAWLYLRHRYTDEEIDTDLGIQQMVRELGENVRQRLSKRKHKIFLDEIKDFTKQHPST